MQESESITAEQGNAAVLWVVSGQKLRILNLLIREVVHGFQRVAGFLYSLSNVNKNVKNPLFCLRIL